MNKTTTLLALAAGTTALLTACGSGASTTTPVAPLAAPQVATSTPAAAPSTGTRPAPVADGGANVDADDQSGDGTTVVVRDVRIAGGPGWVVIRTDDDRDGRVLGAAAVAPGQSGPVTVTLSEQVPATADDDLTAVLHLDDGDGAFDESRDPAVLDADDDDQDDDDVEGDDFDYRVA
ncbi:DUF7282 domain-containing protein [Pseudonocardia saturnea]